MGWTSSYHWESAAEAVDDQYRGVVVLKRVGSWTLWHNPSDPEHPHLTHHMIRRGDGEIAIKMVDLEMGPYGSTPSASLARAYLAAYDGDFEKAGGQYGEKILRRALESKIKVETGDHFVLDRDGSWSDHVPLRGTYRYQGKFRAMRSDGMVVRLPKQWRTWLREST